MKFSYSTKGSFRRGLLGAALGGALLFPVTTPLHAQQPTAGETYYPWTAPSAAEQLAADETTVPTGQGAVFVPALSDGASEPQAVVVQNGQQVATGLNGTRIVVAPGQYVVRVGSGPAPQMVEVPVTVTANQTVTVPVQWAGLRVEVVDENNIPHRGSYELIRVSDRQPYVVGFGADTLVGERLTTLLAPEGLYRIVRRGSNYRARTDFSTVLLPEGALVHYKLVLDPQTGALRGAGVVPPEELGEVTEANPLNQRYSIGVSLPFASTTNVVGAPNQTSVGLDVFFDAYLTYRKDQNFLSGIFEIEEGFVRLDPEAQATVPVQKTRDRIRADVFYTRFLHPRVGPYGRFGLLTNAFESNVLFTESRAVTRILTDGTRQGEVVPANTNFKTGDPFAPVLWRQGAGVNTRLVQNRVFTLDWRGGLGFRQNRFNESFFLDDDPTTEALEYRQAESFNQEGLETTIVGTARYRFLLLNTNLDLFGDFGEFEANVDWRNTVSWRLTRDLSLDYNIDLLRLPQVRDENQVTQAVLFRYSFGS